MNESWLWLSHGTHMNESWLSHGTCMNESVMSHI